MGDVHKLKQRRKGAHSVAKDLENGVSTGDVVSEQVRSSHGELEKTGNLRESQGPNQPMSSSNDEGMEISAPLVNQVFKQELKVEEDGDCKPPQFGELPEKMDIESGFFDQLDDMDAEMSDPLLPTGNSSSPVAAEFPIG